jgi:predicted enzyme related to lactoylglutathione lyase
VAKNTNPVIWFEIPVDDMSRAVKFYEAVLGVKLTLNAVETFTMAWFPMYRDAPGSMGALIRSKTFTPSYAGTMVYFDVDDIDATLARVASIGGKILNPKTSIGEYGFVGHFEDSEGNRVALHSRS